MESPLSEMMVQIINHLDKIQKQENKLDHVINRLDTIQNVLESQNQKHASMETKLSEMASRLEFEKIFMRDQLRGAQNEILTRLENILASAPDPAAANSSNVSTDVDQTLHKLTDSVGGWTDVINEVRDKFSILDQKTNSIRVQILENAQTCHLLSRSTRQIEALLDNKVTKSADTQVSSSVHETKSVQPVVSGQTRPDVAVFDQQIEKRISDINTSVNQKFKQLGEEINGQTVLLIRTLDKQHEHIVKTIVTTTETSKDEFLKPVPSFDITSTDGLTKLGKEMEEVKTSITMLTGNVKKIEKKIVTATKKVESVEKSLNVGHETSSQNLALKQEQDHVTQKIEQSTNEIKDYIYRSKHEIFAVSEKEAQIIRDRLDGPHPSYGLYKFDFYVEKFQNWVSSGKAIDSLPWHIEEMKSSVKGRAFFWSNGNLEVSLLHGRHPREVGLEPKSSIKLTIKATICDTNKKILPNVHIGETTGTLHEQNIVHNMGHGIKLGMISCATLLELGYGDKEGYESDAVLIRFEIAIC